MIKEIVNNHSGYKAYETQFKAAFTHECGAFFNKPKIQGDNLEKIKTWLADKFGWLINFDSSARPYVQGISIVLSILVGIAALMIFFASGYVFTLPFWIMLGVFSSLLTVVFFPNILRIAQFLVEDLLINFVIRALFYDCFYTLINFLFITPVCNVILPIALVINPDALDENGLFKVKDEKPKENPPGLGKRILRAIVDWIKNTAFSICMFFGVAFGVPSVAIGGVFWKAGLAIWEMITANNIVVDIVTIIRDKQPTDKNQEKAGEKELEKGKENDIPSPPKDAPVINFTNPSDYFKGIKKTPIKKKINLVDQKKKESKENIEENKNIGSGSTNTVIKGKNNLQKPTTITVSEITKQRSQLKPFDSADKPPLSPRKIPHYNKKAPPLPNKNKK